MLQNKKLQYLIFAVIGTFLLIIVSILLPQMAFNYAETKLVTQFTGYQNRQINSLERQVNSSFSPLVEQIKKLHFECMALRKDLTQDQCLKWQFHKFSSQTILSLSYFDNDKHLIAHETNPHSELTNTTDSPFNPASKSWVNEITTTAKYQNKYQLSPIFKVQKFGIWYAMAAIPLEKPPKNVDLKEEKETPPAFLLAQIDISEFFNSIEFFISNNDSKLWITDTNGNILLHTDESKNAMNILTDSSLTESEKIFLTNALKEEQIYGLRIAVESENGDIVNKLVASKNISIGSTKLTLILISDVPPLLSQLTPILRGFVIAILLLFTIIMAISYFWQKVKSSDIQQSIQKNMSGELEKMVEARTVELNFVTRTIKDLIDSIPSALIVLDRQLNILLLNLSFYTVFSTRLANVTGRNITEVFSEEFHEKLQKIIKTKDPIIDLEMRKHIEGHGEKVLQVNVLHLLGKRDRLLVVIDDITERKVLERQLIQAEKMSGLGTLMSGVAHEINNPLNAISGMSQIILSRHKDDETAEDAQQIQQYVKRVADIVKELSRYSRSPKVTDAITTDIHAVIEGALGMVKHSRKMKTVQVDKSYTHDLPGIKINVTELEQVFINLMTNSIDALEEKELKEGDSFKKKISVSTSLHGGEFVQIVMQDNGPGIPPENLKKVFDPFFSTKEQGKGTGLGLSISYKIIQRYGGIILVESQINVGTKFTIRLPINQ